MNENEQKQIIGKYCAYFGNLDATAKSWVSEYLKTPNLEYHTIAYILDNIYDHREKTGNTFGKPSWREVIKRYGIAKGDERTQSNTDDNSVFNCDSCNGTGIRYFILIESDGKDYIYDDARGQVVDKCAVSSTCCKCEMGDAVMLRMSVSYKPGQRSYIMRNSYRTQCEASSAYLTLTGKG